MGGNDPLYHQRLQYQPNARGEGMRRAARLTQTEIILALNAAPDAGLITADIIAEPSRARRVTVPAALAKAKEVIDNAPKE